MHAEVSNDCALLLIMSVSNCLQINTKWGEWNRSKTAYRPAKAAVHLRQRNAWIADSGPFLSQVEIWVVEMGGNACGHMRAHVRGCGQARAFFQE